MPRLKIYDKAQLQPLIRRRSGETKLGEIIASAEQFSAGTHFVLLGIPEDIGVRANYGRGGTPTVWPAFLEAFLNIQSDRLLPAASVGILGHLDCSDLMDNLTNAPVDVLRTAVEQIDEQVEQTIRQICSEGKIPIVIGGGHNNAYPIIKGAAGAFHQDGRLTSPSLNAINLDAHADFRALEGRHSGNGFSYAFTHSYLDRYAVVGLHRNYNDREMLERMAQEPRIHFTFWEDIFLRRKLGFEQAVDQALNFLGKRPIGVELDLDSIQKTLASAMTPVGISPTLARQFIYRVKACPDIAYLHICEGATVLDNGLKDEYTGKLIAYLVSDFIRRDLS